MNLWRMDGKYLQILRNTTQIIVGIKNSNNEG